MMNYFYVYIVRCIDGSYYTGHTDNLERRITEHNDGKCEGYTSKRLPVKLVFAEAFGTRAEAIDAEFKIKPWSRKKKQILINEGWEGMRGFKTKLKNSLLPD